MDFSSLVQVHEARQIFHMAFPIQGMFSHGKWAAGIEEQQCWDSSVLCFHLGCFFF